MGTAGRFLRLARSPARRDSSHTVEYAPGPAFALLLQDPGRFAGHPRAPHLAQEGTTWAGGGTSIKNRLGRKTTLLGSSWQPCFILQNALFERSTDPRAGAPKFNIAFMALRQVKKHAVISQKSLYILRHSGPYPESSLFQSGFPLSRGVSRGTGQ